MLEQSQVEELAAELYAEAGFTGDEAIAPFRLATALLGRTAVRRFKDDRLRTDAYLARVGDEWRIYLRENLPLAVVRFNLAHEVAEWALRRAGFRESAAFDTELCSDALGAALLAPRAYARSAIDARGPKWRQLAIDFGSTESCAALRYGEVTGEPLALVTPGGVRSRGDIIPWPSTDVLRSARRVPGLAKTRLRDAENRLVYRVA